MQKKAQKGWQRLLEKSNQTRLGESLNEIFAMLTIQYAIYLKHLRKELNLSYESLQKPYEEATSGKNYEEGTFQMFHVSSVFPEQVIRNNSNVDNILQHFEDGSLLKAELLENFLECVYLCASFMLWDLKDEEKELTHIRHEIKSVLKRQQLKYFEETYKSLKTIGSENDVSLMRVRRISSQASCEMSVIKKKISALEGTTPSVVLVR